MKVIYQDHIEVSEGGTVIASSVLCPIQCQDVQKEQIFNETVCCQIKGQGQDFTCPYYFGTVASMSNLTTDCRRKKNP